MTAKLLVLEGSTSPKEVTLRRQRTVVGRRKGCKLRIRSELVSRIHCSLTLGDNRLVVKDLGSSNGTFINGLRVNQGVVEAGDTLRIGPITFLIQIIDTVKPLASTAEAPLPDEEVVFFESDEPEAQDAEDVDEAQLIDDQDETKPSSGNPSGHPPQRSESIFDDE